MPCKSAYAALDSGKFNANTLAFSTAGWSCGGSNGAYKCKRSQHPPSFTFNSNETCGRFGAPKQIANMLEEARSQYAIANIRR